MSATEFLEHVINEGIEAAKKDYKEGTEKYKGAIDGFEACRNCESKELLELYLIANEYVQNAYRENADNYWYFRCYQAEIEWVCNVVSAILVNEGSAPILPHLPTVNGVLKADEILKKYS